MTGPADRTPTVDALADEALELAEGLGRPLRYVQVNSFYGGSTGAIMRNLHKGLTDKGVDSRIFWGRGSETVGDRERRCASDFGVYFHGAMARLTDRAGFYSKRDTAKLLRRLDEIDPDVVHLHNLHGYYVNVEMLFGWLASHRCQVRWTLHDCWAFTGHCPYFQYVGCEKWRTGCSTCPQKGGYPTSFLIDSSERNWSDKRRIFTSVPPERMTLVSPSHWLEGLVKQSFLKGYPVEVRRNTVDRSVFKPTPSDFRERYGIGDRFMILGVASPWTERKGLGDFVRLARELDPEQYAVVVIGLTKKQINKLSGEEAVALGRTSSQKELAAAYTASDVFFNPTQEDNFPTVNLEAESCGASVVSYDTGGCMETLHSSKSVIASDYQQALSEILKVSRVAKEPKSTMLQIEI